MMWLRMENFNIIGVHEKIQFLGGGGVHKKPGGTVSRFKRGLGKNEGGWWFWGGLISQCKLC